MSQIIKSPSPTKTINNINGWNTRLLYSYCGIFNNNFFDYVDVINGSYSSDFSTNLFDAMDYYQTHTVPNDAVYKGTSTFPSRYFTTGKNVRVKGRFLVSGDNDIFNIRTGLFNSGNGVIGLSRQNAGNTHHFANDNNVSDVPVDFSIIYTSIELDSPSLCMMSNGYYRYEYADYASGGSNRDVVHVPIWNLNPSTYIDNTSGYNQIRISFDGSGVTSMKLIYLTIEELQ